MRFHFPPWIMCLCLLFFVAGCSQHDVSTLDPNTPLVTPAAQNAMDAPSIRIVGSSTVAPFATTVAEHFGATTPYRVPLVETTGTGGGFKTFCRGVGPREASIVNASRRIKPGEVALCAQNGIDQITEVKFGADGIVLANARTGPKLALTKAQLYRALAAELPAPGGGFVPNPHDRWSQIAPNLPDQNILVFGPPPTSGTRDAFVDIAMRAGAMESPQLAALSESDPDAFRIRATTLRTDGRWIDAGENDTAIIQTLIKNPDAVGVFGFSFLDQNTDRMQGASIEGVEPTFASISSGDYTISRSMFFYVKVQNVRLVPGLADYVDAFTQESAWGPQGYLADKGLIPLSDTERVQRRAEALDASRP